MAQIRTAITRAAQILSASAILGQLTWGRGHGATSQPRYAAALPRTRQSLEIRSDRPENRQQRRQSPLTHLAAVSPSQKLSRGVPRSPTPTAKRPPRATWRIASHRGNRMIKALVAPPACPRWQD